MNAPFFSLLQAANAPFGSEHFIASIPLLSLLGTGLLLMLADAFGLRRLLPWLAAAGLVGSALLALTAGGDAHAFQLYFGGMIGFGGRAALMHVLLCIISLLTLFFLTDYLKRRNEEADSVYALLLFAVVGMVMLATANDLIIVFIGLEIMSICLYIMAGLFPKNVRSNESGMKYFLLGAFATGFFLFGITLLYGITGSTRLDRIGEVIFQERAYTLLANKQLGVAPLVLLFTAIGLTLVGFLFKLAAFPFHSWTPDVYTGAPTPLAGFMATGAKLATFMAFIFFLMQVTLRPEWDAVNYIKLQNVLGIVALASMLYGNLVAVQQRNLKRMLAYSSIAHTGYLMLGLMAGPQGYDAVVFYMVIYTLMTVGAFGIISMVERKDGDADVSRWSGLGLRKPLLGVLMSAFLFSMAGIPPLGGFIAKYKIFVAAIGADLEVMAILGILASVVGAYYYLRVIVLMYFKASPERGEQGLLADDVHTGSQLLPYLGVLTMGILLLAVGVMPGLLDKYVLDIYSHLDQAITLP
ncbi:MAG: NADH-quinone oxidoreductase subunit N [Bacteroidetes bacterium]|nr:NADH-quinone oxidoreductase subunit N [Bacteroidota bacterium]